jgi:hypothetical protein
MEHVFWIESEGCARIRPPRLGIVETASRPGWGILRHARAVTHTQESLVQEFMARTVASCCARPALSALLLGAALLAGCAGPQVRVSGTWQEGAPRDRAFSRVLVVGISPDLRQRCGFERYLAKRIESAATVAMASCDVVKQKEPLTRESIEEAVLSQKADAVVATSLIAQEWGVERGGSMDTRGGGAYKATDSGYATGYYGTYGVPVIYGEFKTQASVVTMKGEARLTTKVFETRNATVVYTLDTTAKDLESREARLNAVTTPIADRLRKAGLTR